MEKRGKGMRKSILSEAFWKFRENVKLDDQEKDAIAILTDMFITCSLDEDIMGKEVVKIVEDVNCHHHTRKCQKYQDNCKYRFPRFPLKETLVIDSNEICIEDQPDEKTNVENPSNYKKKAIRC